MPKGTFGVMQDKSPGSVSSDELFSAKKTVLVSVPGAFTPTCSMAHLPGYLKQFDRLLERGVNAIAFIAVNDVFVMDAWGKDQAVEDKIIMLADGNGDYTRALGLELDATGYGMGMRGQRFAIVVDDGTATHVAVEKSGELAVSSAEAILEYLSAD